MISETSSFFDLSNTGLKQTSCLQQLTVFVPFSTDEYIKTFIDLHKKSFMEQISLFWTRFIILQR